MSGNPGYSPDSPPEFVARDSNNLLRATADGTKVRTDHQRKVPEVIGIENITSIVKQCTLTYISKHHTFVTCPIVTITELSSQTPVALSYVSSKNFRYSLSTDGKMAMVSLNKKPEFGHISQMIEISLIEFIVQLFINEI